MSKCIRCRKTQTGLGTIGATVVYVCYSIDCTMYGLLTTVSMEGFQIPDDEV